MQLKKLALGIFVLMLNVSTFFATTLTLRLNSAHTVLPQLYALLVKSGENKGYIYAQFPTIMQNGFSPEIFDQFIKNGSIENISFTSDRRSATAIIIDKARHIKTKVTISCDLRSDNTLVPNGYSVQVDDNDCPDCPSMM